MTAWVIFSPSLASASALSFARIIAEISGGGNVLRAVRDIHLHVRVAVRRLDDFVRERAFALLDLVEFASHEALDRKNGVDRIGDGLPFRGLADETLPAFREATTEGVVRAPSEFCYHDGLTTLHDGHAGISGAQGQCREF